MPPPSDERTFTAPWYPALVVRIPACVEITRTGYGTDVQSDPRPHDLAPGWAEAMARARRWTPSPELSAVVVAPHPDDESLMFGGLLAALADRGAAVHLIAVTDGEAAYPGADGVALATRRRAEQSAALHELGLTRLTVERLGVPDGRVADAEADVARAVAAACRSEVGLVAAPWEHDHHADHEACGRAARRALDDHRSLVLVSGLFWSLRRSPAPAGLQLAAIELTPGQRARKHAAIRHHRSQIDTTEVDTGGPDVHPVLGRSELAGADTDREYVIVREP